MKSRILVLSGGRGGERAVSLQSGRMVAAALDRRIFHVITATLTPRLQFVFLGEKRKYSFFEGLRKMRSLRLQCVFPALHGEFGEDGKLQMLLEIMGIPFVGSGSAASAVAMDKGITQGVFVSAGFLVPQSYVIRSSEDVGGLDAFLKGKTKLVLKPLCGGSSVGITITDRRGTLRKYVRTALKMGQAVIVQEYLQGREMTCGVIENAVHEAIPLTPTEIRPKHAAFFDYKAKYKVGETEEITPPHLPPSKIREIQALAARAHRILGCRGLSRSDFIFVKGKFYILETNTLPGMTKTSLLPQGAAASGIEFSELLSILIQGAM